MQDTVEPSNYTIVKTAFYKVSPQSESSLEPLGVLNLIGGLLSWWLMLNELFLLLCGLRYAYSSKFVHMLSLSDVLLSDKCQKREKSTLLCFCKASDIFLYCQILFSIFPLSFVAYNDCYFYASQK